MQRGTVHNWFGSITSSPRVVEVESVEEIRAIVTDRDRYPSPVRAVGSNHSTTPCGLAEEGTLIVTRKMDRILEIRDDTVTTQAGALYIDVNHELQRHNLQFYVIVELGNLTIGSANREGRTWLASKMVGRWPSGAPLTKAPRRDDPALAVDNDFLYHATDRYGFGCPIGAHVRRTIPRDAL